MQSDVEKHGLVLRHTEGSGHLANFIASDQDGDVVIFRRFYSLSPRNLLYLQSEFAELECLQRQHDKQETMNHRRAGLLAPVFASVKDWSSFN